MRTDEMNEARELGFLGGKLDNPITVKFNDLTDESIEGVANASDMTKADWIRSLHRKTLGGKTQVQSYAKGVGSSQGNKRCQRMP